MTKYIYIEGDGYQVIRRVMDGTPITSVSPTTEVTIDYEVYKELRDKPQTFKDKYEIVEKTIKGEKIKVVESKKEAKDVQQDSKQPKEDNPI